MTTPQVFKVFLIGDTEVGKTSLLQRFANGTFSDVASRTTELDKITRPITIDGSALYLDIWDTAGQERYGGITTSYYRGAHCAVIVYDVTVEETFQDVEQWISDVHQCVGDVKMVLVGNKCDLSHQQVVSSASGKAFADSNQMIFVETSAKADTNVKQLFDAIGGEVMKLKASVTPTQSQPLTLEQKPKKRTLC
eukprot:Em0019g793a